MNTARTGNQAKQLEALLSTFDSTTQLLNALSDVLSQYEDIEGAKLVAAFAETFAAHEESTL